MRRFMVSAFACVLVSGAPMPAAADWCVNLSGSQTFFPFSSQGLFVHFKGRMPKSPGQMSALTGRIAGADGEPVFGTATVDKSGGQMKVAATFFLDAEQGQFWMAMDAPFDSGVFGYAYGDYQAYGTEGSSGQGTVVDCSTEP